MAVVVPARQRMARGPRSVSPNHFSAYPAASPAELRALALLRVSPERLVPRLPSSVAAVWLAAHRTARLPRSVLPDHWRANPTASPAALRAVATLSGLTPERLV